LGILRSLVSFSFFGSLLLSPFSKNFVCEATYLKTFVAGLHRLASWRGLLRPEAVRLGFQGFSHDRGSDNDVAALAMQ
jgi:hypothetical protein